MDLPFRANEVLTLGVAVLLLPVVVLTLRDVPFPGRRYLYVAYAAVLVAYVATNLEAVMAPVALNFVDHAAPAVAGVSFALAVRELLREARRGEARE